MAKAFGTLVAIDAVVKLLAFALLVPLLGAALRLFVSFSGDTVLTDQDILRFVLSPIGLVTLVLVAAGALGIAAIELSCLMAVAHDVSLGHRLRAVDALVLTARRAVPILGIATRAVARVLLIASPFLAAVGLVYLGLLGDYDINYYLAERPPEFVVAVGLAALALAVLAAVLVPRVLAWAYALPLVLFEDVAPARALALSRERTLGHKRAVTLALLGWAAGSSLVATVVLGAFGALARLLVATSQSSLPVLLLVMGMLFLAGNALSFFVTFVQSSALAALVVRLYRANAPERAAAGSRPIDAPPAAARKLPRAWAISGLVAAAAASIYIGWTLLAGVRVDDDVLVIAHRGAAGRAPENTLASFRAALEDGADIVELDVQETTDGEVVVLHDSDFMKLAGDPRKLWSLSLAQARAIDIGSWFDPRYAEERIPTLSEALELCRGKARVDIELKYYGHDQRLEERVVRIVEEADMADDVVVMSLNVAAMRKMRELRPTWTLGVLAATAVGDLTSVDVDFLAVHAGMATESFIRRTHRAAKDIYVWTVNDPVHMSRLATRGADGLITDEPALARSVLSSRAEMSSLERLLLEAAFWLGAVPNEPPAEADLGG